MLEAFTAAQFRLPVEFDLAAMFFLALTGALKAMERDYDFIGVAALALVTGAGGGLLRDVLVGAARPVLLQDARFPLVILLAILAALLFGRRLPRLAYLFLLFDALGLAIYAVVGSLRGIHAGLPVPGVALLGIVNAVGGGVLRDVLVREEPLLFKPGEFYGAWAAFGSLLFAGLVIGLKVASLPAALFAITLTFALRMLGVRYGWRTRSWKRYISEKPAPAGPEENP